MISRMGNDKQKEISLKNITQEEEIMNHYDVAKLTDTEVKQLNEYQSKFSQELGKDVILIAYNDDQMNKE